MIFFIFILAGVLAVLAAFGVQFGPCDLFRLGVALGLFGLAAMAWPPKSG